MRLHGLKKTPIWLNIYVKYKEKNFKYKNFTLSCIFVKNHPLLFLGYISMFFMLRVHINPLTTNVPHHTETIQLICIANQLTGFLYDGEH